MTYIPPNSITIASSQVLDPSFGTASLGFSFLAPFAIETGSQLFTSGVWGTVWIFPVPQGSAWSIEIKNSIVWRGTAADITSSQFRYYNSFRRVTGGIAVAQLGSPGVQGSIASSNMRLIANGTNVELQMFFGVTDTIFYTIPIYLMEDQL